MKLKDAFPDSQDPPPNGHHKARRPPADAFKIVADDGPKSTGWAFAALTLAPRDLWGLRSLTAGRTLTADELDSLDDRAQVVARKMNATADVARRVELLDMFLGMYANGAEIERDLLTVDLDDPPPPPGPGLNQASGYQLMVMGAAEFLSTRYAMEWLAKKLLVAGQPGVVAAPKKALKTSVMVDLAVSLALGLPVLRYFDVPAATTVLLLSGESGGFVLQDTVIRVCRSKACDPADLDGRLFIGLDLPQLGNDEHLAELGRKINALGIKVVIVDPLYLCLVSADAGRRLDPANLFDVGPLLMGVAKVCLDAGATPLLVHHFKKGLADPHALPEMENMAYAGIQEFARQWLLLGRRERYEPGTGKHKLWLTVGGSAGHSGEWSLDVAEGTMDDDFGGRIWEPDVRLCSDAQFEQRAAEVTRAAERSADQKEARETVTANRRMGKAFEALKALGVASQKRWRERTGFNGKVMPELVESLIGRGLVRVTQDSSGQDVYEIVPGTSWNPGAFRKPANGGHS